MSKAIAEIVKRILGIKSGIIDENIEQALDEMLLVNLSTSFDEVVNTPPEEIKNFLIDKQALHEYNVEEFVDMLTLYSEIENDAVKRTALLKNALELLKWYDKKSKVYSFERQAKISHLEEKVNISS
ncbi:MAG: hypothetical protein JW894_15240 [Bacteroidales bacterium]|nr:hypothetical protein [Bacteroidales bacterium]